MISSKYESYYNKVVLVSRSEFEYRMVGLHLLLEEVDGDARRVLWDHVITEAASRYEFDLDENVKRRDVLIRPYIIDTFLYNGDLIALYRVQLLYESVDEIIIVEAWYTHSGVRKEKLYFLDPSVQAQFAPYMSKIKYVVLEEFPSPEYIQHVYFGVDSVPAFVVDESIDAFLRDTYHKEFIKYFFRSNSYESCVTCPLQYVIVGDADEFPSVELLGNVVRLKPNHYHHMDSALHFEMMVFYYNFHWFSYSRFWYQLSWLVWKAHFEFASMKNVLCNQA